MAFKTHESVTMQSESGRSREEREAGEGNQGNCQPNEHSLIRKDWGRRTSAHSGSLKAAFRGRRWRIGTFKDSSDFYGSTAWLGMNAALRGKVESRALRAYD